VIDYYLGSCIVAKDLQPKWTAWNSKTVALYVKDHKRRARRNYKQYLKTGDIRDFNRSQKKITRWDFD
jgi:hypothetical protein